MSKVEYIKIITLSNPIKIDVDFEVSHINTRNYSIVATEQYGIKGLYCTINEGITQEMVGSWILLPFFIPNHNISCIIETDDCIDD